MVAIGMQAHVTILDADLGRLRELELVLAGRVTLIYATGWPSPNRSRRGGPGHRRGPAGPGPGRRIW